MPTRMSFHPGIGRCITTMWASGSARVRQAPSGTRETLHPAWDHMIGYFWPAFRLSVLFSYFRSFDVEGDIAALELYIHVIRFLNFFTLSLLILKKKNLLTARYLSVVFFCTIKGFVEFRLVQRDYISEILPKL